MPITGTIVLIAGLSVATMPTQLSNLIKPYKYQDHSTKRQTTYEDSAFATFFNKTTASPIFNASSKTTPIDRLRSELTMYGSMEENWDGPNSRSANPSHIEDAIAFLEHLPAGIPLPNPMLSSSGEVGLYWNRENAFSDIVFEGNGRFSLFIRYKKLPYHEQFQEDLLITEIKPQWLSKQLASL